jgi:cytochrome c-type biogenesis protein CcmH
MRRLALIFALLWPGLAWAVAVDQETLPDPVMEARAHALMKQVRCLVCQNQSIEDSDADMARDLRAAVRDRVAAGDSDEAVKAWLVARYGDWVLLKPPFKPMTALLWATPALLVALGGLFAWRRLARRKTLDATVLNDDERAALDELDPRS